MTKLDDQQYQDAMHELYEPLEWKENDTPVYIIPPDDNTANYVSIIFAVKTSSSDMTPVQNRDDADIVYQAVINAPDVPDQPRYAVQDDMTVTLTPTKSQHNTETIPLKLLVNSTCESDLRIRAASNPPESLEPQDLADILYVCLPNELEGHAWNEWDDFKYLRDQMQSRLFAVATAVLSGKDQGFAEAVKNYMGDFSTNIPKPDQQTNMTVNHYMGTFEVLFTPKQTAEPAENTS